MTPQQAADSLSPSLASPGVSTKYIAPVVANQSSDWLLQFYTACNYPNFFSAYNVRVYQLTVKKAQDEINAFRNVYNDKPLWVSEIAPENANLPCSLSWDQSSEYMQQIYA